MRTTLTIFGVLAILAAVGVTYQGTTYKAEYSQENGVEIVIKKAKK